VVADEPDGNNDIDRMDDMVADIGRGYDLESTDPPPEVQNFYRLLATSEEKVHDGTLHGRYIKILFSQIYSLVTRNR
jgi:hypothetical protein